MQRRGSMIDNKGHDLVQLMQELGQKLTAQEKHIKSIERKLDACLFMVFILFMVVFIRSFPIIYSALFRGV